MENNLSRAYDYKQIGGKFVVSVGNRQELFAALKTFCSEVGIKAGVVSGLGAVDSAVLRFFDPATKQYVDKEFSEQMEIANLTGNISTMDGAEYLHLHVVLGRSDYSALAGHLLSARINGAGEFIVEPVDGVLERTHNPEIGLNLYDFEK